MKQRLDDLTIHKQDLINTALLEPGVVYIIPLMEQLSLPEGIRARANPRSSTGRLDIFTRVTTDHSDHFDDIQENYQGPLYLEVLSRSFPIRVNRGISLSQVRFIRGISRCTDKQVESAYDTEGPSFTKEMKLSASGKSCCGKGCFSESISAESPARVVSGTSPEETADSLISGD